MKKLIYVVLFAIIATICIKAGCGEFRWNIKTLTDADTSKINFTSKWVTISDLNKIPNPYGSKLRKEPIRLKEECQVYYIKCKIIAYKVEDDRDLHLIICDLDNSNATMIAEIPNPDECPEVSNSHYANLYRMVRVNFQSVLTKGKLRLKGVWNFNTAPIVEIIGVSFFDYHSGTQPKGNGANSMEIHPVLFLNVIKGN